MASDDKLSAEDRLIAEYFKPIATHPGALALTDDAAFITPAPGTDVVLKTDAIIGGVHFFAEDDARDVARKALRVAGAAERHRRRLAQALCARSA